jgi:hypothetical protein
MTPILRFLQSLRSLQKSGVIKSVDEAYDFAKREFGEINDLFKRQIEEIFNKPKGGITSIKREPKGEVIEALLSNQVWIKEVEWLKSHRVRLQGS